MFFAVLNARVENDAKVIRVEFGGSVPLVDRGETILPLVNGARAGGSPDARELLAPATGLPIARVAFATEEDVERAAESAARCLALWRSVPFESRARMLRRFAEMIHDQAWPIARLVALEQGKPTLE